MAKSKPKPDTAAAKATVKAALARLLGGKSK